METLLQLDGNILLFIQEYIRMDMLTPIMKGITHLGDGGWFWIALGVALLFPKKTRNIGFTVLLSLLIGALITNVTLKNAVARIRPYEVIEGLQILIAKPHDYSFPSGHTCASFAAAMVLYRKCPTLYGVGSLILAILIGCSRLYVGVHYPTDVICGALVGCFSAWAAVKLVSMYEKKRNRNRT